MTSKYIKASKYAKIMGLHYRTAIRQFKKGNIPGFQDEVTKTIYLVNPDYKEPVKDKNQINVVLYARVSSTVNKKSLDEQIDRLRQYATAKGYTIIREEKEIASGLNDHRRKLTSILTNNKDWDILLVEHKDRLTRFGFEYFNSILSNQDKKVEVVNLSVDKDNEMMEDFISIVTSFCGRLYGSNRKAKTNKIIEEIKLN